MGLIDAIKGKLGDYILRVGVKRAGGALAGALIGLLTQAKVAAVLQSSGVTYDPSKVENAVVMGITGAVVMLHDFIRLKYPKLKL